MSNFSKKRNIKTVLTLGFLLLLTACQKDVVRDFEIEGKLDNVSSSTIYAVKEITPDSLVVDTIAIDKNGVFKYSGNIAKSGVITLYCGEGTCPISVFLEKEYKVNIKGNASHADLVEVKGGVVNNDIFEFKNANKAFLESRLRIISKKENMDPSELKNINIQLAQKVHEFVEKNPANIASVLLMNEYSLDNVAPEILSSDVSLLQDRASQFYENSALKEYFDMRRASGVGALAPAFTLKSTKGKKVSLKDYKGKNVVLIFDMEESAGNKTYIQNIIDTHKKLKNKKVDFLTIVVDADNLKTETVKLANSLKWAVLKSSKKWNSPEIKSYNVTTVPYMILVDTAGIIAERDVTLDNLLIKFNK